METDYDNSIDFIIYLCSRQINIDDGELVKLKNKVNFEKVNWNEVIRILKICKLEGIIYKQVNDLKIQMPKADFQLIEYKYNKYSNKNKNNIRQYESIINEAFKSKIKLIPIKGISLIINEYKDLGLRKMRDIDFLFDKKDIDKVEKLFLKLGYNYGNYDKVSKSLIPASRKDIVLKKMYTHELHQFVKICDEKNVSFLDVNGEFSWNIPDGLKPNIAFADVLEHSNEVIYGNIKVINLNDEMFFLHLCCHFFNEAIFYIFDDEKSEICKFNKILDIKLFLNNTRLNISEVVSLSKKYNCFYQLYYVASILNIFWNESIPNELLRDLGIEKDITKLYYDGSTLKNIDIPIKYRLMGVV